jgi:long-subunit acyl-CoA synthetase (AMP-forming)
MPLAEFKNKIKELPLEQIRELAQFAIDNELVDFEKSEITKTLKTTRAELEKYKDHVESVILENGINFIDVYFRDDFI